jgi:kinetochore protein Spc25, fungi type
MPPRHGQLNLATILSAQFPTIDLHLPAYEASTRNFSQAIADFNARAIAEINQRREAHATETKRLAERTRNMEKETNQCKMKEIELIGGSCRAMRVWRAYAAFPICLFSRFFLLSGSSRAAVLEREREETKEAESSVAAFRRQVASQQEAVAALDAEIEQYRARVANLRKGPSFCPATHFGYCAHRPSRLTYPSEREIERRTLATNAAPLSGELRACERALGCVIEGVGPDQLLIRYSIKGDEGSRSAHEVSFVLDVSSPSYKGTSHHSCEPDA